MSNEYIRFDWAMKHMLRDKANFDVLEGLINVLLKEDVKIEEILESESNRDTSDDKFNRVDIKAKNSKGHIIIIEVQLSNQVYYLERILYGASKAVTEHITLGQNYDQVEKVYSISILYSDFGTGDDYVYHGTTEFMGLHSGTPLKIRRKEEGVVTTDLPKKVFPEYYIIRVNSFDKIPETPLDEWMEYLKTGKIKEDTRTPGLSQAMQKLLYLKMSPKERKDYERHIDNMLSRDNTLEAAREEGLAEGRAEGRAEEKISIARNLKSLGLSTEQISEATGLPLEEVSEI